MRRSAKLLAPLLIFLLVLTPCVSADSGWKPPFTITSRAVYLVNDTSGDVIYSKNPDVTMSQASLTKLMTAILTVQHFKNLDKVITVKRGDLTPLYGTSASRVYLQTGERMTVRRLLYCLMLPSACDAANTLARAVGGNTTKFVKMMNLQAILIGALHTHYDNAHGLTSKGHHSTAHDTYLIARYAMQYPILRKIVSSKSYTVPATNKCHYARHLKNTNKMIEPGSGYYYAPCKGIKTGYTTAAGHCLVTYIKKDGQTYYCAILGSPSGGANLAMIETQKLYKALFDGISVNVNLAGHTG